MRIIFFGTPKFIEPIINKIEERFEVVKVIRTPQQFNNRAIEQLKSLRPDLFVVAAYGQILSKEVLSIPSLGAINIHPSILPKYRGASPIQSAILNGDKKTGVTFIKMDEEIDHGPIIEQFEEETRDDDTFETLSKRLFEKAADEIVQVVEEYSENQTFKPQDDSKATYTKLLTREDGFINLQTLEIGNLKLDIERAVRAFYPWPSVWTHYPLIPQNSPKTLIKLLPEQKIQVEGKNPMSYKDFKNGYEKGQEFLTKLNLI
ncbi:MAG: hypothetical protein HYT09_04025 [Candidatus Levybacteria bacterium]|nr:hypothetical protein [Candidatus Levybacteria bacterium]